MKALAVFLLAFALTGASGCRDAEPPPAQPPAEDGEPALTNRIAVPAAVRQNLGITFAQVERRAVVGAIRAPGRFELLPTARREYSTPLGGRIELLVDQFQPVEVGQPLYRLDSPGWRQLQREIAEAQGAVRLAQAEQESSSPLLRAHVEHRDSLQASVALWQERVDQLEQIRAAGGGRAGEWAQAQASLTQARADLADVNEQTAILEARRAQVVAELEAAASKLDLLLASAATLLGARIDQLTHQEGDAPPLWRTVSVIEVHASQPGIVEEVFVTSGAWLDESAPVLTTVIPTKVRFRARALQSDLPRLREGLPARIVPPSGGALGPADVMTAALTIGLAADPDERTVDLLATPPDAAPWARPGVSGFLEVQLDGDAPETLAIPAEAVIRDGLTPVIFRRDPDDPDQVIRLEADLGASDGRWVIVKSGLREGDEVVVDGVYQLMLASSAGAAAGGHFHADGTFHEEDH